ncbi:WhiB family transcriptional regulator [Mycolicibacterium sp.]|uniref:WhiB family transcriptional regulator n=1 Tax=Mycolicibacterium sp. TaxID=2320850 RepID=UPI003D0B04C9
MSISRLAPEQAPPRASGHAGGRGRPPGRPHQAVLPKLHDEPERPTPCYYDPELWHPDEQKPNPEAMAACWGCFFQRQCATKALKTDAEFGIWAGYRLAPGPGLEVSRAQLAIIAGQEMGPPLSPGPETSAVLAGERVEDPALAGTTVDGIARDYIHIKPDITPAPESVCDDDDLDEDDDIRDDQSAVISLTNRHTLVRQCPNSPVQLALAFGHLSPAHAG